MEQTRQATILVVDDNEGGRMLLESLLAAEGHKVHSAASGEEALASVAEQLPDIILLDVMLPGIDGFEVMRRLKADSRSSVIPIIMVTALDDRALRLKGLEMGADEFLNKPVNRAELSVRVRNLLKIKAYNDLLSDHNRLLKEQVETRTAELQESETRYRRITDGLMDYQYSVRIENGRAVETIQSPACAAVTGYTAEEFTANPDLWIQMVVPEDRDLVREHVQQILVGNHVTAIEHRIIRKDGEIRWISDTTILFKDDAGKLLSYDGVIKDITERKQADESIRISQARFSTIFIQAPLGIALIDSFTGQIYEVNPRFAEIAGRSIEEMALIDWMSITHPDDVQEDLDNMALLNAGKIPGLRMDKRYIRPDGSFVWINMTIAPLRVEQNISPRHLCMIEDITERKQAESEIQRANRALATLGAVNHALVHATDENTLLQAVCDAIVEQKGYRMAWVGYMQHDAAKSIKIMANAGQGKDYVDTMQLTWAEESERGMGPSGRAIRSNTTQLCQNIANDPQYLPWHDEAVQRGYAATIALPLTGKDGKVLGTLAVYSDEVNAFSPAEVSLLEEMASDLAFGVRSLHIRHERNLALVKNQEQLVQLAFQNEEKEKRAAELTIANKELVFQNEEKEKRAAELTIANKGLQDSLEDTVRAIATIGEMRDPYTAGHQVRVADLATAIAKQLGLPDEQVHGIHLAGVVHDLGKIQIPAEILSKPGKITDIEFSLIKIHPQSGYDILKGIDFPWPIAQMVLQHHERLDGSGYPQGLKGDDILLEARILSVADVVEAMSSHRPYRPGLGIDVALAEITKQRGMHYDSQVVDACLTLFREQGYAFNGSAHETKKIAR